MRVRFAALAVLLLPVVLFLLLDRPPVAPAPPRPAVLIGAHYYPWYEAERWAREPTAGVPALGRYRSAERDVVAQHVGWGRQADLDFFVLSCLDPKGPEAETLRTVVVPELGAAGFRFALHYETPVALGLRPELPVDLASKLPDGTVAGDRLAEHFDALADTHLTHPQYLRYKGRAVVMLYLVRTMENAGPCLNAVRARMKARGIDLYLIADVMYWENPGELDWPFLTAHFDAVTAYNMYPRAHFLPAVERQYRATDRAARARGLRMIPHVLPGYDDTRLRGAERQVLDRADGRFYRDFWALGAEFVAPDQPFLFVTSFNEWHEGTALEPSTTYGESYLHLTRELAGTLRQRRPRAPVGK